MAAQGSKKRKRDSAQTIKDDLDTSKPTAVFKPSEGRRYTLSVALPGSIISNAQSHDLKTALAGQIARALAVFCVDEVVIFDDGQNKQTNGFTTHQEPGGEHRKDSYTGNSDPNHFLLHLLSYLECPPHLRKHLFSLHPDLRTAGTLPSLDIPHHLRAHEWCQYREGVTLKSKPQSLNVTTSAEDQGKRRRKRKSSSSSPSTATLADAGLPHPVSIPTFIAPLTRTTLKFPTSDAPSNLHDSPQHAQPVASSAPREEVGYYWGYATRSAPSLSTVLTECPFDGGYDLTFGTSERGTSLSSLLSSTELPIPKFKHMLIVFGGVAGLEAALKTDEELVGMGLAGPEELFDFWVDLCEGQGSRTVRTEEAVWVGLMGLRGMVREKGLCTW